MNTVKMNAVKTNTVSWVIEQMEEWAPISMAEEWDNVGLIIGNPEATVNKILVALDVTDEVILEAIAGGFDFIIGHHPLIYNPIKRVTANDPGGRKIFSLIRHGIGCYCAHTNLDKALGGVSDCLANRLEIKNLKPLVEENGSDEPIGIGRVGVLPTEMTLAQLAVHAKKLLNLPEIRYAGNPAAIVKTIGVCGGDGSGERYLTAAASKGCDAYITGDLRYHAVQEALEMDLCLLDITHYSSEALIIEAIVERFSALGMDIRATESKGQVLYTM